ncbi:MAG TPA: hypothetical protein VLE95_02065 [Chlamydiales bacterium]|nr:hypothetical protein [Chlamydiales bacterium]
MASATSAPATGPIQSAADLKQFLVFGKHYKRNFPIDTAVDWRILPTYDLLKKTTMQIYQVQVRLNTLKQEQPHGWIDYQFQADTLEKTAALVHQLLACNVKWAVRLERILPLPGKKMIRLNFSEGWAGTLIKGDSSTENLVQRDVFMLFSKMAGVDSEDYRVVPSGENGYSVDLVFDSKLTEEQAIEKMNQTLAKMQTLCSDNVVFKALKQNGDPKFHVQEEEQRQLAKVAASYHTRFDTCIFKITEDDIQGINRFPGGESIWKGVDIPHLVANQEHAH